MVFVNLNFKVIAILFDLAFHLCHYHLETTDKNPHIPSPKIFLLPIFFYYLSTSKLLFFYICAILHIFIQTKFYTFSLVVVYFQFFKTTPVVFSLLFLYKLGSYWYQNCKPERKNAASILKLCNNDIDRIAQHLHT